MSLDASFDGLRPYTDENSIRAAEWTIEMLLKHPNDLPANWFHELLGNGSYKEAYRCGNLCIKFAVPGTIIENEQKVYAQAFERGIDHVFCPTYFHKLPDDIHIPLTELEMETASPGDPEYDPDNDEEGVSYYYPRAAYLILQPVVGLIENVTYHYTAGTYLGNPLILQDGTELSPEEYFVISAPLEWRQSIIDKYGDLGYRDISWGLRRMSVEDLHSGNVGWLGDKPVIIDWMSLRIDC